ncbi:MAG: hypothetical protein V4682_02100 [Patescibacteria group bacterium]
MTDILMDGRHTSNAATTSKRLDPNQKRMLKRGGGALAALFAGTVIVMAINQPHGTIEPNDDLATLIGYKPAVQFAAANKHQGMKIYRTKDGNRFGETIDLRTALATDTDRSQVTVLVYAGDRYDRRFWRNRYIPANAG